MSQPAVLALLVSAFWIAIPAASAAPQPSTDLPFVTVVPSGETSITEWLAGSSARAVVVTHVVSDVVRSSEPPVIRTTSCTYSRYPCSVVDRIDLFVNGNAIFVPRSVFSDLADLNRGRLMMEPGGNLTLSFDGGDASESYELEIVFNEDRVLSRKKSAGEFPDNFEMTTYVKAPPDPGPAIPRISERPVIPPRSARRSRRATLRVLRGLRGKIARGPGSCGCAAADAGRRTDAPAASSWVASSQGLLAMTCFELVPACGCDVRSGSPPPSGKPRR